MLPRRRGPRVPAGRGAAREGRCLLCGAVRLPCGPLAPRRAAASRPRGRGSCCGERPPPPGGLLGRLLATAAYLDAGSRPARETDRPQQVELTSGRGVFSFHCPGCRLTDLPETAKWPIQGRNTSAISEDYLSGLEKKRKEKKKAIGNSSLKTKDLPRSEHSCAEAVLGLIGGNVLEVASLALHVKTFQL